MVIIIIKIIVLYMNANVLCHCCELALAVILSLLLAFQVLSMVHFAYAFKSP
jgi:hypothetical protein